MRFVVLPLLLVFASFCWADSVILNTAYGSGDPGVIGDWYNYDIKSASLNVTGATATMTLLFNYGLDGTFNSGTWKTLGQYTDNHISSPIINLNVGDMFFYDPADTTFRTPLFGVPLTTRGSLQAGDLYGLAASGGTESAQTVLGNPSGVTYRNSTAVWINPNASPTLDGAGSVSIVAHDGASPTANDPLLQVTVTLDTTTFNTTSAALFSGGKIGFQFESATCANDFITGDFIDIAKTPEPSSLALAAGGLLLAAIGLIRRKRSA